ncbi:coiled-coil domain-containing protein 42 homolog [Brachyistius frenatus]|uniref:coiled-coil domain-containing protein 42 homolog n=1 Tax=Brachyistius frenatus TaxID=100188 RepID=UPI0037E822DF
MSARGMRDVTAAGCDSGCVPYEIQMEELELDALKAKLEEGKQVLEILVQRVKELKNSIKKTLDLIINFDKSPQRKELDEVLQKIERKKEEKLQLQAKIKKLLEEYIELTEMKQELQCEEKRLSVYCDYMKQVCQKTKFKDVEVLTDYMENLLHFRNKLYQSESKRQDHVDQMRKEMLVLEDQHNLLRLQRNNELSSLHDVLEKTRSEALTWERKWNYIQETAAKKTLMLGQIKMGTLNLYEMTGGIVGDEGVDMNDTEKQLEYIKTFLGDHTEILKQHQTPTQRLNNGQKPLKKRSMPCLLR